MPYYYKTYGREYSFTLESDGLIHCKDLGLSHETLTGLISLVTAEVKKEKSLPRIPVIIIQDYRWGVVTEYVFGSASTKEDRHGYRWVSYKHKGRFDKEEKTKRQTVDTDRLFLDTEQNREFMEQAIQIGKEIEALKEIQSTILSKMQKIGQELKVL